MPEFIHCHVCNTDHEALRFNGQLIAGCPEVPEGWFIPADITSWFKDAWGEAKPNNVPRSVVRLQLS